jgi:outer membrane protein assembly factor BamB
MRCTFLVVVALVWPLVGMGPGMGTGGDKASSPMGDEFPGKTKTSPPKIAMEKDNKIVKRDGSGKITWSTTLDGPLGRHRDPHLLLDPDRVYVSHGDGVTALEEKTGRVLWHTKGPSDRLYLSGNLLLATDCTGGEVGVEGRFVSARAVANGKEVFKVRLPAKDFDPQPIVEVAGLFLVQICEAADGKGSAFLIDREGKVRHRFDREVVAGRVIGKDRVFLTSEDMVRVRPDCKVLWTIPVGLHQWPSGGGLVDLPGGNLLAFQYGVISDSGVHVVRVDPAAGKVVWQAHCAPLGVSHSKYRHQATVVVEEKQVKVTSRGSFGRFIEVLHLESGRQVQRTSR